MSTRNALFLAAVLCAMLALGFVAGRVDKTPAPPYTITVMSTDRLLVTDSQSGMIRLMELGYSSRPDLLPPGPRLSDGRVTLVQLAQFDLTQLPVAAEADEAASSTSPGKP